MNRKAISCSIEGCRKPHWAKGLCSKHYRQLPEYQMWQKAYNKKYNEEHSEEIKELKKKYYLKDVEKWREKSRKYKRKLKIEILSHYSPELRCQRCGFSDIRALSIDHINGGGRKHHRKLWNGGRILYEWIKKNNYPQGFQVLCMNCQWIKRDENRECRKAKEIEKMIK